jgi:acyl-CoA reductase-like NAD-dependent aldehyde dehydrogenase
LVHETIIDEFRDALVKHTKLPKLGEGNEEGVFLGPIQNTMQFEKVKGFFADIEKESMKVAVGGTNPGGKGYFITPTIIDRPAENSRLVLEEPFGKHISSGATFLLLMHLDFRSHRSTSKLRK